MPKSVLDWGCTISPLALSNEFLLIYIEHWLLQFVVLFLKFKSKINHSCKKNQHGKLPWDLLTFQSYEERRKIISQLFIKAAFLAFVFPTTISY